MRRAIPAKEATRERREIEARRAMRHPSPSEPSSHLTSPMGAQTDEGWRDYEQGAGRFIAGMGRHTEHDRYGNPIEEFTLGQIGGHRTHRLTKHELPSHSHTYEFSSGSPLRAKGDFSPIEFGSKDRIRLTGSTGKNAPHTNLPPFIALRYCIFVGQ